MTATSIAFPSPPQPGLVTAVIPTYNRARLVGRAIESALAQTYRNIEIVVVDDGSTDETRKVVEAFGSRVRYVRQENAGVSAARNHGMRAARGEFIAFLDSDDAWQPWKIEAQIAVLRGCPAARIVWTDMSAIDTTGRTVNDRYLRVMYAGYGKLDIERTLAPVDSLGALWPNAPANAQTAAVRAGDLSRAIMLGNLLHTSTVLFKRTCVEQCGGFDDTFPRTGEDYEFYVRLTRTGAVVFIDAPSTLYRIGAGDQLGRSDMALEISRNDLRTLRKWLPSSGARHTLPPDVIARRIAESLEWVASAELDAGHNWAALRRALQSVSARPAIDRRVLLLVGCALPASVRRWLLALRRRVRMRGSSARPSEGAANG